MPYSCSPRSASRLRISFPVRIKASVRLRCWCFCHLSLAQVVLGQDCRDFSARPRKCRTPLSEYIPLGGVVRLIPQPREPARAAWGWQCAAEQCSGNTAIVDVLSYESSVRRATLSNAHVVAGGAANLLEAREPLSEHGEPRANPEAGTRRVEADQAHRHLASSRRPIAHDLPRNPADCSTSSASTLTIP